MARTLEFYFDYGSPYSYLADTQVEAIARRAGASLVRKPMLLGGVFKATGGGRDRRLLRALSSGDLQGDVGRRS